MSFFRSSRRRTKRRHLRVFSLAWLGLCVAFLGLYGWFAWNHAVNGIEAAGVLVERFEDDPGDPVLVIRYISDDGQPVLARLTEFQGIGHTPVADGLQIGDPIRIRYVPSDPTLVRPATEPVVQLQFLLYGGLFLLLGVGMAVYSWWIRGPDISPGRRGA